MCGIAGIYGAISDDQRRPMMDSLAGRLAHRGPDGSGFYWDDQVGLVHRRLSIIDLSAQANQPLYNEDRSIVLICNGEIYNYQQLREELLKQGHRFSSHSDSETIIHLYEQCNGDLSAVLNRLTGMFAFALWDTRKQQLFVARDRVGIKPLYYCHRDGKLIFSSEVQPIAGSSFGEQKLDKTSLFEYFLLGSIPGPNTLYEDIKCLEPGHYISVAAGKMLVHEYWDIPEGMKKWSDEDHVLQATEDLLSVIVKDHLIADVPVGTFLSAGVDSSLITALAVDFHPGIHDFTASFPGEPEDEELIAADTAKKLRTTHHIYPLKDNFFNDFSSLFSNIDQPFAISSALSLGRISRLAKQKVKVVLSGDGGDELFGGYGRHEFPKHPSFLNYIPKPLRNDFLKLGAKVTGKHSLEKLRQNIRMPEAQLLFDRVKVENEHAVLPIFSADVVKEIDTARYLRRLSALFEMRKDADRLNRLLYVDMKSTLVDEMLTKCDRMTMLNGIEGRVPFLDHRFVELAFSIPGEFKRKAGTGKLILRKLLAKRLGNDLAYRVKTGFNAPLKQWLEHDRQTIDFVHKEMRQVAKLDFIDHNRVGHYEKEPAIFNTSVVFALVCLNHFFSENTGHHK